MMLVTGPHRNLYSTLNRMLDNDKGSGGDLSKAISTRKTKATITPLDNRRIKSNKETSPTTKKEWFGKKLKSKSIELYDFGSKINIVVRQEQNRSKIELQVSLQKGCILHEETVNHLRSLYGTAVNFSPAIYNRRDKGATEKYEDKVSFSITVNDAVAHFDSTQSCAHSLSQIRVQAAGAPILNALYRISKSSKTNVEAFTSSKEYLYNLGTHGTSGSYHCISNSTKAMMVYRVCFEDEMERSLARLFLQELQNTQSGVSSTPYCEYRRPNDMTEELKRILDAGDTQHNSLQAHDDNSSKSDLPPAVGYLTFTFFPLTCSTEDRRRKAVELVVNFLPYLDRHVKSTKSMMLSRMRMKKDDLLYPMKVQPGRYA